MSDDPITVCEIELRRPMLDHDVVALDRLIDDALVFTMRNGVVVGKQDDLEAHRTGRIQMTALTPSDQRIVRCGRTAVVNVRMEVAGTFGSTPFSGGFRYTRVWHEQPEGWRVIAGHVSPFG